MRQTVEEIFRQMACPRDVDGIPAVTVRDRRICARVDQQIQSLHPNFFGRSRSQRWGAASRQAYAGLIPDHALRAISPMERARRWAESLATAASDEAILVGQSNARILGLGHCGPQRTPSLPFAGEFYCLCVLPEAQRLLWAAR
jgi:hypothetical protein